MEPVSCILKPCGGPKGCKLGNLRSVIIPFSASKSLSFMLFGVLGLKRTFVLINVLLAAGLVLISCSSSPSTSSTSGKPSGLKVRAFVSNPLQPSGTGSFAQVLNIVDATLDQLSPSVVGLTGTSQTPGLMALSSDKQRLLVFSSSDHTITVVNTATEAATSGSSIRLPDTTKSMVISPDNSTG